jgi:23S rRNA pseudouridine1911/1915/1917 synthase
VRLPPPGLASAAAEAMPLVIVYEDADVIVVDKPAGLVVHPGAGNADGTLVNGLLAHCPQGLAATGLPLRPGIVHRLDKDTSGLIVVAKTDRAYRTLTQQFALHSVERAYWAFVWGVPSPSTGRIDTRIGRSPGNRLRMAVVPAGGKRAITHFRTVRTFGTVAALLECRLATGRTHQIRVHMAATGHPLIGDTVYGRGGRGSNATGTAETVQSRVRAFPRQALHAYLLGFRHPEDGAEHRFCSELPSDLIALQDLLEAV